MAPPEQDPNRALKVFFESKKILIADQSASTRSTIARVLIEMGAKSLDFVVAPNYEAAIKGIQAHKPPIIFCDYDLGEQNGLSLIDEQRELVPHNKDSLVVLVTSNASELAIAEAADQDIDAYLLKPITLATLTAYVFQAIQGKLKPTKYQHAIMAGRSYLDNKAFDLALTKFQEAVKLEKKPTLAYYYLGVTQGNLNNNEEMENAFKEGLKINPNNYRCLTGILDLLVAQSRTDEAYKVGSHLFKTFPLGPKHIEMILQCVVRTKNFDDVQAYFVRYANVHQQNKPLNRCLTAALIVAGKKYSKDKDVERAKLSFQSALKISERNPLVFKEAIVSLVDNQFLTEADEILAEFKPKDDKDSFYHGLRFLLVNSSSTPSQVIEQGRKCIEDGVSDPTIYEIMIKRAYEVKLKDYAEMLKFDACKKWPHLKGNFEQLKAPV